MRYIKVAFTLLIIIAINWSFSPSNSIVGHETNLKTKTLKFFWKNDSGQVFGSISQLKKSIETKGKKLNFAMNGGMYMRDQTPLGLYIENGETKKKINAVKDAFGNFYMQPNGIFTIYNNDSAAVINTTDYQSDKKIKYATQSGPMLLINGDTHPKFNKGSSNLNIRNGVGILPNGNPIFAISKKPINFYDFAEYFKKLGCKNALYLDGFVSRAYIPAKNWTQTDGQFGVIMAEIE